MFVTFEYVSDTCLKFQSLNTQIKATEHYLHLVLSVSRYFEQRNVLFLVRFDLSRLLMGVTVNYFVF